MGGSIPYQVCEKSPIRTIIFAKFVQRSPLVKKIIPGFILLILTYSGCRQNTTITPPEFTGYKNNPVLSPGDSGSWDELSVSVPQIICHDNVFYLFYMGYGASCRMAVGLATSNDGVSFRKFEGNPVLSSDDNGFDAFTAGPGRVLIDDSVWVMYYNGQELAGFSPGRSVGRATALIPTGPWERRETPVLYSGSKGEWDAGFIIPCSVLKLDDGIYRLYYLGGTEFTTWKDFYIGMATSSDGINWKKYNDPSTTQHPFTESDPVLLNGDEGAWDEAYIWIADVTNSQEGFRMYYTGAGSKTYDHELAIGYAESKDGIHWIKYSRNPVYRVKDDPCYKKPVSGITVENPSVLFLDTIALLYYDYGSSINEKSRIGFAKARVH